METLRLALLGNTAHCSRLQDALSRHPLRDCVELTMRSLASIPSAGGRQAMLPMAPELSRRLRTAQSIYLSDIGEEDPLFVNQLASALSPSQLLVLGEQFHRPLNLQCTRQMSGTDWKVAASTPWLNTPVASLIPQYLRFARQAYGSLLWVNVHFDQATSGGATQHLQESLVDTLAFLRALFPRCEIEPQPLRMFLASHRGKSGTQPTFMALVGVLRNTTALADTCRSIITMSGGNALGRDRFETQFVFAGATITYHRSIGLISLTSANGEERDLVRHYADPYLLLLDRLLAQDISALLPVETALRLLDMLNSIKENSLAQATPGIVKLAARYPAGEHPLPEWPADGLISALADRRLQSWSRYVGLLEAPALRTRLAKILLHAKNI